MKPKYKGRQYYYKKDSREDYHYIKNQPLGYGQITLENFQANKPKPVHFLQKPREYPGVL